MNHHEKEHVKKLVVSDLSEKKTRNGGQCDVIILQTFPFEPAIDTAAVRTCAKFQIASIHESEDREV